MASTTPTPFSFRELVFIVVFILTLALILFLAFRERVLYPRLSAKLEKRLHIKAAEAIAFGNWELAEKHLIPLLERVPMSKETSLLYAQVLGGTHRTAEALNLITKAAREYPEELLLRLEEGKLLLTVGRFEEALSALNVCAPILRSEIDLLHYAIAHFQNGDTERALTLIEPFVAKTQNGRLVALAADCLYAQKRFVEAIALFKSALECGYKSHHVWLQLGHSYRRLGNLTEGEKIFRALLEKDSGDVAATLGLGACLQERGFYNKALLIYQAGKAWEKRDLNLLRQAAVAALFTKKFEFAESYFTELIDRLAPSPELMAYLGYCLECRQKWREAEELYLHQMTLFPDDPTAYRSLAWLFGVGLTSLTTPAQGLAYAQKALEQIPDALSWEILSACEARIGNFTRAHEILQYLASFDNDSALRARRLNAMRLLRKQVPLRTTDVLRVALV